MAATVYERDNCFGDIKSNSRTFCGESPITTELLVTGRFTAQNSTKYVNCLSTNTNRYTTVAFILLSLQLQPSLSLGSVRNGGWGRLGFPVSHWNTVVWT